MTDSPIDVMLRHRSIRKYRPDEVSDEDVVTAVRAGQAASTSSAVQAYCLIRVRDAATRARLAELTGPQAKVAEAGAFFVVAGDTRRHRLCCRQAAVDYDTRLEAFLLAVVDATLFSQNLALGFEALGYGICYIGGLRTHLAEIDRVLELPEGIYPLYGLCVGVPDEAPRPRPRLPIEAVLSEERYPSDDAMVAAINAYDDVYRGYLADRGVEPDRQQAWSTLMANAFTSPAKRPDIGQYYCDKGADLT